MKRTSRFVVGFEECVSRAFGSDADAEPVRTHRTLESAERAAEKLAGPRNTPIIYRLVPVRRFRLINCKSCGRQARTTAYQTEYCSKACAWRERKRAQRAGAVKNRHAADTPEKP